MNCATCWQPPLTKQQQCFLPLRIPSNSMFCVPSIKPDCGAKATLPVRRWWNQLVMVGLPVMGVLRPQCSYKHQLQLKSVTSPTSTARIKTAKMLENVLAGLLDLSVSMHVPVVIARIKATANRKDLLTLSYMYYRHWA